MLLVKLLPDNSVVMFLPQLDKLVMMAEYSDFYRAFVVRTFNGTPIGIFSHRKLEVVASDRSWLCKFLDDIRASR